MTFCMFYAERIGDPDRGEPYIAERGIFLTIEEFRPYRRRGWIGSPATNDAADAVAPADDATDAQWMRECAQWTAEHGMSSAVRTMLAFHCCQ